LGAWLVLEKWMTPKLFEDTQSEDEYYLAHDMDQERYEEKIKTHRAEFITEGDFVKIAALGFNIVRIPVPYFIFNDRPPFIGCIAELDRAFNWAEANGLKILIDLHTSPYNQNAFDNGGISGVCKWAQHPEEVDFVLSVLMRLAGRYKARNGLWGIEILNEPLTPKMWDIIKPQEQFPLVRKKWLREVHRFPLTSFITFTQKLIMNCEWFCRRIKSLFFTMDLI